ncbi:MAG TPA: alpha,alpha-trehalose-phosphate synthase (UDP-forming) [Woeseiaceae bacterium]|nr:alpha,alpha-trehalose-phosphate synthase (UDP-forming) [Woeseiaceae bacterium]
MSARDSAVKRRIVAVSNRVATPSQADEAVGGLAVGVLGALEEHGGIWFGWNGDLKLDAGGERRLEIEKHGRIRFVGIDLDEGEYEGYYNGFSNKVLWPLFHYLLGFIQYRRADFEAYLRVNATFAKHLVPLLEPDDIIWVHDYHLIPLASELRKLGADQPIGFFLHVPFPGYDVLQVLPDRDFILKALCAYDVVGFHTARDLASFKDAVTQPAIGATLEQDHIAFGGRRVVADVFPIGVDVDLLARFATEAQGDSEVTRTLQSLGDRQFIIGVDRLDYSKGLEERFRAYARFLEKYPEARGTVSYTQIAPPTRVGVRAYEEIRHSLEQTTGAINGRFATLDWVPLKYINRGLNRRGLMGLLRLADVGLVTPIRDGMNLVAKEFVAAQDPANPGVLVLSELAGAARELQDAVLVNPYDTDGVADGIHRALTMPLAERKERHHAMMSVLRRNDIVAWRDRFVAALLASRQGDHERGTEG